MAHTYGVPAVLFICGMISLIGVFVTAFFVKDLRGKNMTGSESRMGYASINSDEKQKLVSPVDGKGNYNSV